MDPAIRRFRRAAARENRGRVGLRRRYSAALQRQAAGYCAARQRAGTGVRDVAAALGVAPWSLVRWMRAGEGRGQFHAVQVEDAAPTPVASVAPVVVIAAEGLRVEGLDLAAAAQLVRLLR